MSGGEIIQNTPAAKQLQDAIQTELVSRSYASEGDEVMAEFCAVMVANLKSPAQINAELTDLIGPDYEASFTDWLFKTVAAHFPNCKPALTFGPPKVKQPSPVPSNNTAMDGVDHQRQQQRRGMSSAGGMRSGGSGVFGNAIAGVKRPNDGSNGRDAQRQRMDPPMGAPTGPRNPGALDGDPSGGIATRRPQRDGQALFDRLGPQPFNQPMPHMMGGGPPFFPMMMQQQQPDMVQMQIDSVTGQRNGHMSGQPQMMFMSPGPGQPPQMAFFPYPGAPPQFMPFGAAPPGFFPPGMQQQQAMMSPGGTTHSPIQNGFPSQQDLQRPARDLPPVPTKPANEALCKHATLCTNAYCKYAHPSPAATKESGLVLNSEPCEKQTECQDKDCPLSHVSPRASDPANSVPPAPLDAPSYKPSRSSAPPPPPQKNPTFCKFGAACTRPDCIFTHPWDSKRPAHAASANLTPCRFGANCTRADCHFTHPPSRKLNKSNLNASANRSVSFTNNATPTTAADGSSPSSSSSAGAASTVLASAGTGMGPEDVAAKLKETQEEKDKLNERMRKFAVAAAGKETAAGSAVKEEVKVDDAPMEESKA